MNSKLFIILIALTIIGTSLSQDGTSGPAKPSSLRHESQFKNQTCTKNQYKDVAKCACSKCVENEGEFVCQNPPCDSENDLCCPAGKFSYIDENEKRKCENECPKGMCVFGGQCFNGEEMQCPPGYHKDLSKAPSCCVPCTDKCCSKCTKSPDQCDDCIDADTVENTQYTFDLNAFRCDAKAFKNSAEYKNLAARDTSGCQCCKKYEKQCHCQWAKASSGDNKCHKQTPECPVCPVGSYDKFYLSGSEIVNDNICSKCDSSCLTCFGQREDQCILCDPKGKTPFLLNDKCLDKCPPKYFASVKDCNNLKHKLCKQPYTGQYSNSFKSSGVFSNDPKQGEQFMYCEQCSPLCSSCAGPANDQCTACVQGATLFGSLCIKDSQLQVKE